MIRLALAFWLLFAILPFRAASAPVFAPPPPLHIGIGGDYPNGLDGAVASLGLPHERLFPWEMADPEALKRYEVILLSCPVATQGTLDQALTDWLAGGGRAYVETWEGNPGAHPLSRLVSVVGATPAYADLLVDDRPHPIAAGLDPKTPIDLFHLQGVFIQPTQPDQARALAAFCPNDGGPAISTGSAVVAMPVGQGELVYSGAPLAFCRMHRGPTTEVLLNGIIRHLLRDQGAFRLVTATPDIPQPSPSDTTPDAPAAPQVSAPQAPPEGLEALDEMPDGPYNVTLQVGPATQAAAPTVLLLDGRFDSVGRPTRSCLWLTVAPDRLELRTGASDRAKPLAVAAWTPPAEPSELLVQRRSGSVSVVHGDTRLLEARLRSPAGGLVAVRPGGVAPEAVQCQVLGEPVFSDDFMRDTDEPSEWTPVSGEWATLGVGHEEQSINGFFLRGQAPETGVTTTGEAFWEDYTVSVAVRPESDAACGVAALRQANGDCLAFVADSEKRPDPGLRLVRLLAGQETVLAERAGGVATGQWYRLALRVTRDRAEGLLDGEAVCEAPNPIPQGGGIALLLRGGSVRFDDVLVQPAGEALRSPRDEGTPAPELPVSVGPQDGITWANPASLWRAASERPSVLWHQGDFPGNLEASLRLQPTAEPALRRLILAPSDQAPESEWVSVTARLTPGVDTVAVELARPGANPVSKLVRLGSGGVLCLRREGKLAAVLWDGKPVLRANAAALRKVGVEIEGPPVPTEDVGVRSPEVRDYVFGAAPTDWWVSAGTWEVAARWACDNRWSWFAGWGTGPVAAWNKHPVEEDVVVDYWVGVKMDAPGGPETARCRDLNTVLCGDRAGPLSGYSLVLGGDGGRKTQLLRNGAVVAEAPEMRVPAGYGIHHEWLRIRAARVGSRVELDLDGRPVFRWEDPEPLPGGYVGLWTQDSGILIPRVTIYGG